MSNIEAIIKDIYNINLINLPAYQIGIIEHYYKLGKTKKFLKEYIMEVIKDD
mgnify:CR=1 FL=1|tara:strand:- start:384 stop:539 length:156 start_codon:yes stop_codon:yes gene_type:complete